jgi:hypothetical protein
MVPVRCLAAALLLLLASRPAAAQDDPSCRVVELEMMPTEQLQMVAWLEDPGGNYVDTIYITRTTGSYGLGNRPGIMEFNSGPLWPYGRRVTTFPVWAGRHGMTFPLVEFQDGEDDNLSHALGQSSRERTYCRPIRPDEQLWDAQSCASTVYTDKGTLSPDRTSAYPPRSDIAFDPIKDDESVESMITLNPFDAVSRATPGGNDPYVATWPVPMELANGDYVLWLEVSAEFDQNEFYDYPEPEGIPWSEYGVPYRGQPSVLYRMEFSVGEALDVAEALDYVGYGDPDGIDADVREPDETITSGVSGSGDSRLLVLTDGDASYRVRVSSYPSPDDLAPDAPGEVDVLALDSTQVDTSFRAPGDDGLQGIVAGYEVRYLVGDIIDDDNFEGGQLAEFDAEMVEGGDDQELVVRELLARTSYSIGVRAYDECGNVGPVTAFAVTTPRTETGRVDACFIATAAYGSLLASDVAALRSFRDVALRTHIGGELAVEGYYTFGPLLASAIAPSDTLRRAARAALAPLVEEVRAAGF